MPRKLAKHLGGRPLLGRERRRDYKVTLEPAKAAWLRKYGGENLSGGIARAVEQLWSNKG